MGPPRWTLSDTAKHDLLEIAVYTAETWGAAQGDAYIEALYAHLDRLCDFPLQAQVAGELFDDEIRVLRYRSHSLFYKFEDEAVVILRVLHTSQDPDAALRPPTTG